jgi:adenosylcobinamide kinase/adenosylcobinamide-phosphate guanylyltransferase
MGSVILVTGGAKSGKSLFAETLAGSLGEHVVYVATADVLDEEMAARVARHRAQRPATWITLEAPRDPDLALSAVPSSAGAVLVDCLTIWSSNRLLALGEPEGAGWWDAVVDLQETLCEQLGEVVAAARARSWHLVMVTNEVGYGVVPDTPLGRAFRDVLGAVNQRVAGLADAVFLVVAGLATEVKGSAVDARVFAGTMRSRHQGVTSSSKQQ